MLRTPDMLFRVLFRSPVTLLLRAVAPTTRNPSRADSLTLSALTVVTERMVGEVSNNTTMLYTTLLAAAGSLELTSAAVAAAAARAAFLVVFLGAAMVLPGGAP